MKVKDHIMGFIKNSLVLGNRCFYTHDIQSLSDQGLMRFGRRLGSYGSYNRIFRELKADGYLDVRRVENPKSREAKWEIRGNYA